MFLFILAEPHLKCQLINCEDKYDNDIEIPSIFYII